MINSHITNWIFTSVFNGRWSLISKKSYNKTYHLSQRWLWENLPQGFSQRLQFIILSTLTGSLFSHQWSEWKRSTERLGELISALLKFHGVKNKGNCSSALSTPALTVPYSSLDSSCHVYCLTLESAPNFALDHNSKVHAWTVKHVVVSEPNHSSGGM